MWGLCDVDFVRLRKDETSLFVAELAAGDDDKVDNLPDAKPSKGEQHENSCANFTDVEAVDAEAAEKKAEKNGSNKTFRTFFHNVFSLLLWVER